MIACHDDSGRITNLLFDPVPDDLREHFRATGQSYVDFRSVLSASEIVTAHYVTDNHVRPRPPCPTVLAVEGRVIRLNRVKRGSVVIAEVEGQSIPVTGTTIELDEAGPVTITVTSPWPYMEARYDLSIE